MSVEASGETVVRRGSAQLYKKPKGKRQGLSELPRINSPSIPSPVLAIFKMVIRSTSSPLTPELDVLVQQQMDKWKVPGLTMAIVHGSSTWSKVDTPTN
jgi:hypothetical protein